MIDLLKNKKLADEPEKKGKKEVKPLSSEDKSKLIEEGLKKYKDPEGLTLEKLNKGLWWVQNRPKMLKITTIVLAVISIMTWSLFILTFGYYLIFGIKKDQQMVQELTNGPSVNINVLKAMSAQNLRLQPVKKFEVIGGRYDFMTAVANPNKNFFVEFDYYFINDKKKFGEKHGFILPNESKYFFSLGKEFSSPPNEVQFIIENVRWKRIDTKKFPNWEAFKKDRLNISADNIQFTPSRSTVLTEKLDLNELKFTIHNNTIFNYWHVNLKFLLHSRGEIIGVNENVVNELITDESRDIVMTWPGRFGYVDSVEIVPELDILDEKIYIDYTK